jgi:hypothetical protein
MRFSLPNIVKPVYIQQLTEGILPPIQNIVGFSEQITILITLHISNKKWRN